VGRVDPALLISLLWQHIVISAVSVAGATVISVPLGIAAARNRWLEVPLLWLLGVLYTIPSLALFALLIPLFGLGVKPAVVALVLYSLLTLARNTMVGIRSVPRSVVEAAVACGMTRFQILRLVELPLSLPVILAGIRQVTVMTIGIAAVAAFVGAGGLGVLVFRGLSTLDAELTLAGAIPITLLALLADGLLARLQRRYSVRAQ
jgi:osmoprotectant transport system permease protein